MMNEPRPADLAAIMAALEENRRISVATNERVERIDIALRGDPTSDQPGVIERARTNAKRIDALEASQSENRKDWRGVALGAVTAAVVSVVSWIASGIFGGNRP